MNQVNILNNSRKINDLILCFVGDFLYSSGQSNQFGGFHMGTPDPKRMLGHGQREHPRDKNIKIRLENRDLWQKFHSLGTEMIITKTGR